MFVRQSSAGTGARHEQALFEAANLCGAMAIAPWCIVRHVARVHQHRNEVHR